MRNWHRQCTDKGGLCQVPFRQSGLSAGGVFPPGERYPLCRRGENTRQRNGCKDVTGKRGEDLVFPGPAESDADCSMESPWVHSPQFAAQTKQFLVTPDTPLFVSAANQKVNMSDWQRQGGQNFIVRTAWFLQGDRTLRNQTGSPRRLGTSDSGSRMISTTMQAGERVSRYEADRSVMENTDP